jgi:hypothetical protein
MALFTEDTHFVVYMNAKNPTPTQELHSREALAPIFGALGDESGQRSRRQNEPDAGPIAGVVRKKYIEQLSRGFT